MAFSVPFAFRIFAGGFGSSASVGQAKLDTELTEGVDSHPIFVRFADQLLPEPASYERFAESCASRKRREVQAEVHSSQHSRRRGDRASGEGLRNAHRAVLCAKAKRR